jgi:ComF family protein
MAQARRSINLPQVFHAALNAVLPPQCLSCGDLVSGLGTLCAPCWESASFLSPPQCHACGLPFEHDFGAAALCGACTREPPLYARARAALAYDDISRAMILAYKHGDRTDMAPAFGRWLARAGAELLADADVIVPVPLHWTRLFGRRFNQTALLARQLAQASGRPVLYDGVLRTRRTRPMGQLSKSERRRNLAGAFAVKPAHIAAIKGRRILLVDDVLTSGATASNCTKVLLKAGAKAVDVLTIARVAPVR